MDVGDAHWDQVYWLGGAPCAGKSSISRILADRHGLGLYQVDDAWGAFLRLCDPVLQPAICRWLGQTWDARWLQPADALLAEALACYREQWAMTREDVGCMAAAGPLLVEGTSLMPAWVAPLLVDPQRALWLLPEPAFQRRLYTGRAWAADILAQCSQPELAFDHWMARDSAFARLVAEQAAQRGLQVIEVDGRVSLNAVAELVAVRLGLVPADARERAAP